jgi:hypothetical protein
MKVYKLFRVLKNGEISSLFINKTTRLPIGEWLEAQSFPTNGYKYRPYWHCTRAPKAPHLSEKNRAWYAVEIEDFTEQKRPENQGGIWYLANRLKILHKI